MAQARASPCTRTYPAGASARTRRPRALSRRGRAGASLLRRPRHEVRHDRISHRALCVNYDELGEELRCPKIDRERLRPLRTSIDATVRRVLADIDALAYERPVLLDRGVARAPCCGRPDVPDPPARRPAGWSSSVDLGVVFAGPAAHTACARRKTRPASSAARAGPHVAEPLAVELPGC